jgi:hypothetical protein
MGNDPVVTDVPAEFARRRRLQIIVTIPLFVCFFAASVFLTDETTPKSPLLIAGFAGPLVSLVVFSLVNWRCPACRAYLRKTTNPKFCPNCGVALRSPSG